MDCAGLREALRRGRLVRLLVWADMRLSSSLDRMPPALRQGRTLDLKLCPRICSKHRLRVLQSRLRSSQRIKDTVIHASVAPLSTSQAECFGMVQPRHAIT
jgi:hypothetical protein